MTFKADFNALLPDMYEALADEAQITLASSVVLNIRGLFRDPFLDSSPDVGIDVMNADAILRVIEQDVVLVNTNDQVFVDGRNFKIFSWQKTGYGERVLLLRKV